MKKTTKIWLIIAACFVAAGLVIFTAVMWAYNWDFSILVADKYETNIYEISDDFTNLSFNTDTADITFRLSDDSKCRVVCYEEKKAKHSVATKEDTLFINMVNEKAWYDYIGINFSTPKIAVYLPRSQYADLIIEEDTGDVTIPKDFKFRNVDISMSTGDVGLSASASGKIVVETSTGDINIQDITAEALKLTASTGGISVSNVICEGNAHIDVSTGKVNLTNTEFGNLTSDGDTGDISLDGIMVKGNMTIERDTGNVKIQDSDAAEILIETDTGDVTGNLLTDKIFIVNSDTGRIRVPKTVIGGKCEITTDTGDIKITVE